MAKKILNRFLNKLGLQLSRINTESTYNNQVLLHKYTELIKETEALYREFLFQDLKKSDGVRVNLLSKLLGTQLSEAIYIINLLNKSLNIEGDVCEFGIAQGATSALLANEITKTNKTIWLFDSFKGLPKPTSKDLLKDDMFNLGSIEAYEGTMSCEISMVKKRLEEIKFPFNRVKIIDGFIEETINSPSLPTKVCFAYIDFDFYQPIFIALNFLDEVLQTNGWIVVDDYDFFSTGAKDAVDEFISKNKNKYKFSLPIKSAGHFCLIQKVTS